MNIPMETCSDYQINHDSIEILPYDGYYEDIELAVFDELPSYSSNSMFSKQYTLKNSLWYHRKKCVSTVTKDKINEMQDEIEELKKLTKELKNQNKELVKTNDIYKHKIKSLESENKRIKCQKP
jgi:TolA-binding protein